MKHDLTHLPGCSLATASLTFHETVFAAILLSTGHMAIYNLLSANYHSRKYVTSHTIVMSNYPVMKQFLE